MLKQVQHDGDVDFCARRSNGAGGVWRTNPIPFALSLSKGHSRITKASPPHYRPPPETDKALRQSRHLPSGAGGAAGRPFRRHGRTPLATPDRECAGNRFSGTAHRSAGNRANAAHHRYSRRQGVHRAVLLPLPLRERAGVRGRRASARQYFLHRQKPPHRCD
jgi:hypothetical protein